MESEYFLAIYNISPILRGHSLVIPKKHIQSLFELSEKETNEFFTFSRSVTKVLIEAFKGEGYDWSIQEGKSAGQSVPHLHLHIVVRKPGDLKKDEEWYDKVRNSEREFLDTSGRTRLSDEEYLFYTDYLKHEAKRFKD